MARPFEEVNAEKWTELRAQLEEVKGRAEAEHRRDDVYLVDRGVTFADWAWRMITALRQEVRRLGGDPDRVQADFPPWN